nr:hypothetical protein [Tanacetum cinerariifolium]
MHYVHCHDFQLQFSRALDKILVSKPPKNCARCGHPVDGLYCQGCTFLQKKLEEDLVTHFQGFQNTSESSDDSTNIINIPLEEFVVKQDHESFVDKIICGLNKAPDSPHLHTFSPNQFHCFHCKDALGDGEACQRCTCKRCGSGLSKGLCLICRNNQNSPNDSPSISANSSHNPPHIDERCFKCGDALDEIFCQQCACKSCGKGAHIGCNCPPKVSIISNPEPCNQTMNNEPPQTLPSFDSTCYSDKEILVPCVSKPNFVDESSNIFNPPPRPPIYSCEFCGSNAQYGHYCTPQVLFINPEPGYSQDFNFPQDIHDFQQQKCNRYSLFETPKVLLLAWDRVFKIKDAFGNEQYKPEDVQELFHKLLNDVQNIHEELAEYNNTPSWNRTTFYNNGDDDDVDYTIAITPVLSTEEPDNSLSMGDEHLDTIPATELDEVIKSSVEDLVPILSEFKGIPNTMCDMHLVDNPTPLEAKDHFEIVINSNDDYSSSDDDSLYYENIEYVDASPHDSEFVSLEVEKIVIPEDEEIANDNLREKLLKQFSRALVIFMDTTYGRRWIRRIGNCEYAFLCEDLALIHRISFPGYDILAKGLEIKLISTSVYHSQANREVKRANRSIMQEIKTRLHQDGAGWVKELPNILWAHRTMPKTSNRETPISLAYGTKAVIPVEICMPTRRTTRGTDAENDMELRQNLNLLQERREIAIIREARQIHQVGKY